MAFAQHLCLLVMVFELSPLVAGEGSGGSRSSLPERDVMGCQQRDADPCRGGAEGAMGSSPGASVLPMRHLS